MGLGDRVSTPLSECSIREEASCVFRPDLQLIGLSDILAVDHTSLKPQIHDPELTWVSVPTRFPEQRFFDDSNFGCDLAKGNNFFLLEFNLQKRDQDQLEPKDPLMQQKRKSN